MKSLQVLRRLVKQHVSQAIQSASTYMTSIGFSESLFVLTLFFFPLLRLLSFLLQSIGSPHTAFLPFVTIAIILLLLINGIRFHRYVIALFYRLLNTRLAQLALYTCLCCEQMICSRIVFGILIGVFFGFLFLQGVVYQRLVLLANGIILICLTYYRLRRRLWNDDAIHFVSTPEGVLWADALHGLDTAFRCRMVIDTQMRVGVTAPDRVVNRLPDPLNIAFPFLIRKRGMRTAAQEGAKPLIDWAVQNPGQIGVIATGIATTVLGFSIEGWREHYQHQKQMEAARQAHIEQMEAARQAHIEQMEEKITKSIEEAKERYSQSIQTLERERAATLDSVWRRFSLDKPQILKLNEKQMQEAQANFEAYQKQQEQLIHSIRTRKQPNQYPADAGRGTPLNPESMHGAQTEGEERAQSTVELIGTQAAVSSPDSLAMTNYSSILSPFL